MAGSGFGEIFRITTWGESHGGGIGVIVDGCPAGLELSESDIMEYMDRRRPGQSAVSTKRKEEDKVHILSGVFEGKTLGTSISMMIDNNAQKSSDYEANANFFRPGHADYTYDAKYGIRDYRGGGRASGRETAGRVAGGAVAAILLKKLGIRVCAYTKSIGNIEIDYSRSSFSNIEQNEVHMPDPLAAERAKEYVAGLKKKGDSAGGVVECVITGVPAGLGEPVFDKLDAQLCAAIMSIGAVKGFEVGDGFASSFATGSENNDLFFKNEAGKVCKKTNHAGGILGGISDGSQIIFRAAIKPTPSIAITQSSIDRELNPCEINVLGRHDPVIVPRAVVVVETMAAAVLADMALRNVTSRIDTVKSFYDSLK